MPSKRNSKPEPIRKTKQERHEEVLAAAAKVFAARGYRAATIHEIAAELDISGAALYYYVRSKEDLLVEICWRAGMRLHDAAKQVSALEAGPEDKLRRFIRRHLEITLSDRAIFAILIQERSELPEDRVAEMIEGERAYFATVRQLIEDIAGHRSDAADPRLAAFALIGMLNWVLRWYQDAGAYQVEDVADGLFRIFWAGVQAPSPDGQPAGLLVPPGAVSDPVPPTVEP